MNETKKMRRRLRRLREAIIAKDWGGFTRTTTRLLGETNQRTLVEVILWNGKTARGDKIRLRPKHGQSPVVWVSADQFQQLGLLEVLGVAGFDALLGDERWA